MILISAIFSSFLKVLVISRAFAASGPENFFEGQMIGYCIVLSGNGIVFFILNIKFLEVFVLFFGLLPERPDYFPHDLLVISKLKTFPRFWSTLYLHTSIYIYIYILYIYTLLFNFIAFS